MSGTLSLLSALTGWRSRLRPGSFRGAPFWLDMAPGTGGRRIVKHQFPQRDDVVLEDLGQEANEFQVRAFVVGDNYMDDRDALISACQDHASPGMLVHPTLGTMSARVGKLQWLEHPRAAGGYCSFDITFHKEGIQPVTATDSLSRLLSGLATMAQTAITAYQTASLIAQDPALLLGFGVGLLTGAGNALLALPSASIPGIAGYVSAMSASVLDAATTAGAVQTAVSAVADAVIAAQAPPLAADDPVTGTVMLSAAPADLTGGLIGLTTWGDTLPAPAGAGAVLAQTQAQQAAIVALVEGAAVQAVLTIYGQTDFVSVQAAAAARTQVVAMIDRQTGAANAAGNDDLYRAWLALGALAVTDMIQRAQNLPNLVAWTTRVSLPALVLAQQWYQDPARDDEIVALNDVPHPLFAPVAGMRLSV
jgi:prophage DNA circulation protein